jgi:rubrerythrin
MDDIFAKIANKNNTTKEQVEKEISRAIDIAIKNSKGNKKAEKFWKDATKNSNTPTAETVIKKISEMIQDKI